MTQAKTLGALRVRRRSGMTLVEMLVAMTCTILLMLAITQTFQSIGEVSAKGRAGIEMSTQLRGVWLRLQEDLQAITVPVRPWPDADGAAGYFEYYDGPGRDDSFKNNPLNNLMGDVDDILAMTCRTTGEPFVGRYMNNGTPTMIESNVAEVIWYCQFVDKNGNNMYDVGENVTLHRRVLLVRPDLNDNNGVFLQNQTVGNVLPTNDISVRQVGNNVVANSLADLTQRENRFAHVGNFPTTFDILANGTLDNSTAKGYVLSDDRLGEDVILSNVIGFDVRVFDKKAPVQLKVGGTNLPDEPVAPGDPGFAAGNTIIGYGAYVDLNHNSGAGDFNNLPVAKSQLTIPVYDTWSFKYEHDGIRQHADSNYVIDGGTDGLDNNNGNGPVFYGITGVVDDVNERETSPPYPVPLRGIQVRLRVIEHDTRQVRQATLVQDFIPE